MVPGNPFGVIARHWRGGYRLPVALAGMGALAAVPPAVAALLLVWFGADIRAPAAMLAALLAFPALVAACLLWHGLGVWRAGRRAGRAARWAARLLVVLAGGAIIALLAASLRLQLPDAWAALQDEPDWPATSLRVLPGGRVIALSGPLRWSAAAAIRAALREHGDLRVIELDSPGGRVSAGLELHDLIRARGLETLVRGACVSACTDAFLAGRRRWATAGAKLGFHQGQVGGATAGSIDAAAEAIYRAAGLDPAFIGRVLTTGTDIWFPDIGELRAARVVTDIATPGAWPLD